MKKFGGFGDPDKSKRFRSLIPVLSLQVFVHKLKYEQYLKSLRKFSDFSDFNVF